MVSKNFCYNEFFFCALTLPSTGANKKAENNGNQPIKTNKAVLIMVLIGANRKNLSGK